MEKYIQDYIEVLSACGVSKLQVALDRGTDRDGADAAAAGGAQVLVLFRPQVEQLYEVTGGKQRRVGVEHVQVGALLTVVAERVTVRMRVKEIMTSSQESILIRMLDT